MSCALVLSRLFVSDATDQLEQRVIDFFINAKKNKPEWREEQMEVIKKVWNLLLVLEEPEGTCQI